MLCKFVRPQFNCGKTKQFLTHCPDVADGVLQPIPTIVFDYMLT
ncbi:hypothetical protein TFLX_04396 [Thermoflexales bacterium]|nr:hypothetical protein TFLX_04396 [Thermoflexales bacterium]